MKEVIIVSILNIVCFLIGAIVGQKSSKGEPIKIENPVTKVREIKDKHETKKEQEIYRIINENIDNYDGTGLGQQDIPR